MAGSKFGTWPNTISCDRILFRVDQILFPVDRILFPVDQILFPVDRILLPNTLSGVRCTCMPKLQNCVVVERGPALVRHMRRLAIGRARARRFNGKISVRSQKNEIP